MKCINLIPTELQDILLKKLYTWKGEQETRPIPGCNAQTGDRINNVSKINLNKGFTAIITL